MSATRVVLGVLGVVIGAFGALELASTGVVNVVAASVWLLGGVLVHDGVVAPATMAVAALGASLLPRWTRPAAAAAVVVLGTVTIMAIPVLGRFGARADNSTLLDRPYVRGWLVVVGLVLACASVSAFVARRRERN